MANNRGEQQKAPESLGAWFMKELRYAIADIRHKVVEEGTYGRAVTPHWRDTANTPQPGSGIHGKTDIPAQEAGGVHGKTDAPSPDAGGGVHGKPDRDAKDKGPELPAEPKGLGMSYAELTAGWEKAVSPGQDAARERQQPKEQEHAVER